MVIKPLALPSIISSGCLPRTLSSGVPDKGEYQVSDPPTSRLGPPFTPPRSLQVTPLASDFSLFRRLSSALIMERGL